MTQAGDAWLPMAHDSLQPQLCMSLPRDRNTMIAACCSAASCSSRDQLGLLIESGHQQHLSVSC